MLLGRRNVQQAGQWNAVGSESGLYSLGSRALPPSRLLQTVCAGALKNLAEVFTVTLCVAKGS